MPRASSALKGARSLSVEDAEIAKWIQRHYGTHVAELLHELASTR